MFHRARNGLCFRPHPDGSVEIFHEIEAPVTKTSTRLDQVPLATLPRSEWDSVVAAMGETPAEKLSGPKADKPAKPSKAK